MKMTAPTLEELSAKVHQYSRAYSVYGYGTTFSYRVPGGTVYLNSVEAMTEGFKMESGGQTENGEYYVDVYRYHSCD